MTLPAFVAYSKESAYKRIDHRKQLFLDNDIVGVVKNVKRSVGEPAKFAGNPVIEQDRPWEKFAYFRTSSYTVLYDEQDRLFKCWYEDLPEGHSNFARFLYAVSQDGVNWVKPEVGIVEDGRKTNIVWRAREGGIHSASFLIDPNEPDPARRFKSVFCYERPNLNVPKRTTMATTFSDGLSLAFSADGINWTPYEDNPIIAEYGSDVEILTWDPIDGQYVMNCRAIHVADSPNPATDSWFLPYAPDQPHGVYSPRRKVTRVVSDDCIHWSAPVIISEPGPDDDIQESHYGLTPWRVDEYHLGFLMVFHQVDNTLHFELVHSLDGLSWKRLTPGRSLIPRGEPGSYDSLMIECPSPFVTVGDEHWIYYGGSSMHHDYYGNPEVRGVPETSRHPKARTHLGLARIRVDGWVALEAGLREGYVETKPVYSEGSKLIINAKCNADGYVAVEVMDNWNNVWPGFTREECDVFDGDSVDHVVSWGGRTEVNGVPWCVKLRFWMRNAELYSFRIADD